MPVWFPPLERLETFIPEPEWLRSGLMIDEGSFGTAEGSLEQFDDEDDFYDPSEDFGNASMAFSDDDMLLGDDDMFYFDSMRDMDDLKERYVMVDDGCGRCSMGSGP